MDTETTLTASFNSFGNFYTSEKYNPYSTATVNININSSLNRHGVKRGNGNVATTEMKIDHNLSGRNNTKTVCNNSNDKDKINYESFKIGIENEKRELAIVNDTVERMLEDIVNVTWLFINDHDENVGNEAIKLGHAYVQQKRLLIHKIRTFNTHINGYNCKFTSVTYSDIIPEEGYEEELRQQQNIMIKFEYLHGLISDYYRMHAVKEKANSLTDKYNALRHLSDLKKSIEEGEIVKEMIRNISENVKMTNNFSRTHNLEIYFVTDFTTQLLDSNFWELQSENKTKELEKVIRYVQDETVRILVHEFVQPVVQGIIFLIGFVGNGVMIIIFARQRDIRTATNMMLLNLAIGDVLNLTVNIPVFYSYTVSTRWRYGLHLCKAYRFLRQLGIGVSIYSIVALSVQRFLAVTQFDIFRCHRCRIPKNLKSFLIISSVWLAGCMIAVPHTIHAGIYDENCYAASDQNDYYPKTITLIDLLLFCVIPLSSITAFSVLSAYRLKKSIRKLPGEAVGMQPVIQARAVSSNVLIALAIVSAISYIPLYLLLFLYAWTDFRMYPTTYYVVFFITYTLLFGNSCFNPIALYIVSRKFRGYFNRYLFCRREKNITENHTGISRISTDNSSTIETRL